MDRQFVLIMLLLFVCASGWAADPLSVALYPGGDLPLSAQYFTFGGGLAASGEYRLPFFPFIAPRVEIGFDYWPIWSGGAVNMLSAAGGFSAVVPASESLICRAGGSAGYYYGVVDQQAGGNLFFAGRAGAEFAISPSIALGVEARYRWLADGQGGTLFSGVGVTAGIRFTFLTGRRLQIDDFNLRPVFPVLYKYYAGSEVGAVSLTNRGSLDVADLSVSLNVAEYMANPTVAVSQSKIAPGETVVISLTALFSDNVLSITEGDVVSANLVASYTMGGREYTDQTSTQLQLYDRHAITWDDDRKAAAYVTAKDPTILEIAKPIAAWVSEHEATTFDSSFRVAMGIHEAMGAAGISYVIDPTTPYIEYSEDEGAIDYLQFPTNTLRYGAGDCDDLSILYSSLLQAVGVETAFITIPGHIYMAFALTIPENEARRTFLRPDDLIYHDGRAWVPFEATLVGSSFLEAWNTGAEQWRANEPKGDAAIFPLYRAWQEFQPVASIEERTDEISLPDETEVRTAFAQSWERFVARETRDRIATLESRIASARDATRYINSLGVLYARYGMIELAKEQFERAVDERTNVSALVNLGNIYFLQGDLDGAERFFRQAQELEPDNPGVLLQLARSAYELGRFDASEELVAELRELAPEMLSEHAYLDSRVEQTTRASARDRLSGVVPWAD